MDESDRPSRQATTKVLLRTGLLFLVFALPAAALDVGTTELARREGGYVELNPADFIPLRQAILKEMGWGLMAMGMVLAGAYYRRDALTNAVNFSWKQFRSDFFSQNGWAVTLIWLPFLWGVILYSVVISNICYLTMGWSPIDAVTLNPLQALLGNESGYVGCLAIGLALLWYPAAALTIRSLYAVHHWPRKPPNKVLHLTDGA
jgi:hypothetical protein